MPPGIYLFRVGDAKERHLRVRFPAITESDLAAGRAALVKIRFKCRVLRFGAVAYDLYRHGLEQRY